MSALVFLLPILVFILQLSAVSGADVTQQEAKCMELKSEKQRSWCLQLQNWSFQARIGPAVVMRGPSKTRSGSGRGTSGSRGSSSSGGRHRGGWHGGRSGSRGRPVNAVYDCFNLDCLCYFMENVNCTEKPLKRVERKEYRMLTDDERHRFQAAMLELKNSTKYAEMAAKHADAAFSGSAHSGPAFLPWHREFLKRMEFDLRLVDPSVSIPYWDSSLDAPLPDPRDSMLFTADFLGEADESGDVVKGSFAHWYQKDGREHVHRSLRDPDGNDLFTQEKINLTLSRDKVGLIMTYFPLDSDACAAHVNTSDFNCENDYECIEMLHGSVHMFIGGDMGRIPSASNDPAFFLHHCFIDLVWELWRQMWQTYDERATQYPPNSADCMNSQHFRNNIMQPFDPVTNLQGISNNYTDNLFTYAPRPTCTAERDCGSPYLFCDREHKSPRCVAKVHLNGKCEGFEKSDICYEGKCKGGKCKGEETPETAREAIMDALFRTYDTNGDDQLSKEEFAAVSSSFAHDMLKEYGETLTKQGAASPSSDEKQRESSDSDEADAVSVLLNAG